jgi:hypothetical protein
MAWVLRKTVILCYPDRTTIYTNERTEGVSVEIIARDVMDYGLILMLRHKYYANPAT